MEDEVLKSHQDQLMVEMNKPKAQQDPVKIAVHQGQIDALTGGFTNEPGTEETKAPVPEEPVGGEDKGNEAPANTELPSGGGTEFEDGQNTKGVHVFSKGQHMVDGEIKTDPAEINKAETGIAAPGEVIDPSTLEHVPVDSKTGDQSDTSAGELSPAQEPAKPEGETVLDPTTQQEVPIDSKTGDSSDLTSGEVPHNIENV